MLVGTAVKLAGNLVLVPLMGADGAAVSTSVCYAVILAVSLTVYVSASGAALPVGALLKVLYAGAMCGGAAYLADGICTRAGAAPLLGTAVSIASGAAMYLLSLVLLSVKRPKKQMLPDT